MQCISGKETNKVHKKRFIPRMRPTQVIRTFRQSKQRTITGDIEKETTSKSEQVKPMNKIIIRNPTRSLCTDDLYSAASPFRVLGLMMTNDDGNDERVQFQ